MKQDICELSTSIFEGSINEVILNLLKLRDEKESLGFRNIEIKCYSQSLSVSDLFMLEGEK